MDFSIKVCQGVVKVLSDDFSSYSSSDEVTNQYHLVLEGKDVINPLLQIKNLVKDETNVVYMVSTRLRMGSDNMSLALHHNINQTLRFVLEKRAVKF